MMEVINRIFNYLASNYAVYMVITMSSIVAFTIGMVTLIKKPIKKLTAKIKNEKIRKSANKVLILIAFGISAVCWVILSLVLPKYFSCEATEILLSGAFAIVIYALGDGIINADKAHELVDEIFEKTDKISERQPTPKNQKATSDAEKAFWERLKK